MDDLFDRATLHYGDTPSSIVRSVPLDAFRAMLARRNVRADADTVAHAYREVASTAPPAVYEQAAIALARAQATHAAALAARARPRGSVAAMRYERSGEGEGEVEDDSQSPLRPRLG